MVSAWLLLVLLAAHTAITKFIEVLMHINFPKLKPRASAWLVMFILTMSIILIVDPNFLKRETREEFGDEDEKESMIL